VRLQTSSMLQVACCAFKMVYMVSRARALTFTDAMELDMPNRQVVKLGKDRAREISLRGLSINALNFNCSRQACPCLVLCLWPWRTHKIKNGHATGPAGFLAE